MKKIIVLIGIIGIAVGLWAAPAKNVIWLIGDGMGPGTMGMFMQGVRNTELERYPEKRATLEKFINNSVSGFYFNNTFDTVVTDSACAATQMACGQLSRPDYIGVDEKGEPLETLMEEALKQGKSVGVITDVYVTDATPAGFLSHTISRRNKNEIARQLVNSGVQVVMGGGLKYFTRQENENLLPQAKKQGWQVVVNSTELDQVKKGRVLGLFSAEAMPFYGDMEQYPQTPTLLEMTRKAVELLSQNEKGFVLMVEAGKVDWALHDNEMGPALWEMINLDETLDYIWTWSKKNGETLVYLNADHETGVPVFRYQHLDPETVKHKSAQGEMLYNGDVDYVNYPYYQNLFAHKHMLYYVYPEFEKLPAEQKTKEKLQQMVNEAIGVPTDLALDHIPSYKELVQRLNQAQQVKWATGNHSAGMLLGVAYGPGAELFSGVYHNTDLKAKFEKALGFTE